MLSRTANPGVLPYITFYEEGVSVYVMQMQKNITVGFFINYIALLGLDLIILF